MLVERVGARSVANQALNYFNGAMSGGVVKHIILLCINVIDIGVVLHENVDYVGLLIE